MSLGDSLGFGYSQAKLAAFEEGGGKPVTVPTVFTGYTAELANHLDLPAKNLSCPGETTGSMIQGPCPAAVQFSSWLYSDSQLAAAADFLRPLKSNRGVITLSIGANDALSVAQTCVTNPLCPELKPMLKTVRSNLTGILRTLRHAAPRATIVVLTPYNPYARANEASNIPAIALNATIGLTALLNGARVADAFGPINVHNSTDFDCGNLIYYCSSNSSGPYTNDIHPTDNGYALIAKAFENALR